MYIVFLYTCWIIEFKHISTYLIYHYSLGWPSVRQNGNSKFYYLAKHVQLQHLKAYPLSFTRLFNIINIQWSWVYSPGLAGDTSPFFITTCSPFGLGIDQLSTEVDDIEDFFDAWSDGQRSDLQSLEWAFNVFTLI